MASQTKQRKINMEIAYELFQTDSPEILNLDAEYSEELGL